MQFHVVIGKSAFFVYRKDGEKFEPEYIDGNPYYRYILHNIKSSAEQLLAMLVDINNLDDENELDLVIIENSDRVRNVNVEQVLKKCVKEKIKLSTLLLRLLQDLSEDKSLYIDEFGVNYDGECYVMKNSVLKHSKYSLLAYTVNQEMLMNYV